MKSTYQIKIGTPFINYSLKKLKDFLKGQELEYDETIDYSVNIVDENNFIIASGSLDKNIIKCVAVSQEYRNEGLSSSIISLLVNAATTQGITKLFIYTKPFNESMFQQLGFYTIEKTQKILLMENKKNGLDIFLNNLKNDTNKYLETSNIKTNKIGCIVANCNPFTNGHLYLMDTASKQCDLLHVFILSGSNKMFKEEERIKLVKDGLKTYKNIIIHSAKDYILSPLTFPNYFIKDKKQTSIINCELDIKIFMDKIVPLLNITHRFVGTEPSDLVTNSYNNELIKALNQSKIELVIINRKEIDKEAISASKVRKCIETKDFDKIYEFVPQSTYDFIINKFSKPLVQKNE
jgi:[citrate (pro-3S)-lyase] ligase